MSAAALKRVAAALTLCLCGGLAQAAPVPARPTAQELDQMQAEIARFEDATKDYRGTVKNIVQQEYVAKRKALLAKYQGQINDVETQVKQRRASAIAMFESFLERYPHDARWTPDAMFRLAELYFEKSNDAYLTATATAAADAPTPVPDYHWTVDLYRQLITHFPSYRLIDGAYYLMGWCLGEMNKTGESLQAMSALVCANKYKPLDPPAPEQPTRSRMTGRSTAYDGCVPIAGSSRFMAEAWTRIGETHFDNSELELAIAAYTHVLDYKDSPYFDKALYKLAWSYYRGDDYPNAIKRFDQLVVYSDKMKAQSGEEGSDLRQEAIQYLGISFAEKDWDGDSLDDPVSGLQRIEQFYAGRESEPHVHEVYAKLGDIFFDETEYFHAIEVYKAALAKWPNDPGNPKLQDRIVMAFERQRDFPHALAERETLARSYVPGTPWYQANLQNRDAIESASQLAELALISAAVNHHKAAQDLKKLAAAKRPPDANLLAQSEKEYGIAARFYAEYLARYPSSKNAYEYSYNYAETLYWSGHLLEAGTQYEKVRDSKLDNKYAEDAAFNAVKAYEKYLEVEGQAGRYQEPPLPAEGKTAVPVQPLPIPEVVQKLQKAYDTFTVRVPESGRVPTMAYKAAEIDYRYLHWDVARPRLEQVLGKYCKDNIGADAGNAIVVSYTIEKNLDKIEEWANKLKGMKCGSQEMAQKNAAELGRLSLSVRFKKADQLFAQNKYEAAAAMYVQIVDADPQGEDADKALNNAAVAYEKAQRYAAATALYERIVSDYPNSKFLDDALFRTAVTYSKFFEFDKAVVSYQRLASDQRFAHSPHRTQAIYNAALILENDQNYRQAAELFKRYAADSSVKREDAAEAFFRAGLIYEKMKEPGQEIATFKQYVRTFGKEPSGEKRNLEAYFRMAEAYAAEHDKRAADEMYKTVVQLGAGVTPASDSAEYPAHAEFILTEQKLPPIEKAKISGGGKHLAASIKKFQKSVQDMVADYNKVIGYRRATWTLAAYFRTGYLFELFSRALLGAPCPPEVKRLGADACDVYRDQIEQTVAGVDNEAIKRYKVTLQQAGLLGVSNEWTKLARIRANAYNPEVFPLVKDERIDMQLEYP